MPYVPTPQPCWLVLIEGDWCGCGRTRDIAAGLAADMWADEAEQGAVHTELPVVQRADGLCVQVRCSVCGGWWADPWSGLPLHGVSMVDAFELAWDDGWVGDVCPRACWPI